MAAKKEVIETDPNDGSIPVTCAYIYEPVMMVGVNGLKTLNTKETPGLKLWRSKDATLIINYRGIVGEIRNFKLLVYA